MASTDPCRANRCKATTSYGDAPGEITVQCVLDAGHPGDHWCQPVDHYWSQTEPEPASSDGHEGLRLVLGKPPGTHTNRHWRELDPEADTGEFVAAGWSIETFAPLPELDRYRGEAVDRATRAVDKNIEIAGWRDHLASCESALEVERRRTGEAVEALYGAHEFIESVTGWKGQEDDHAEALTAIDDALASLDAGEPERADDRKIDSICHGPASVEGEPEGYGDSWTVVAQVPPESIPSVEKAVQAVGGVMVQAGAPKRTVAESLPVEGGGDGRPDRYTFTHDKSLGIFAEFADDGFVYAPKPFLLPREARARVGALWAVPVDREARIEIARTALREAFAEPGILDIGRLGVRVVDALSGVLSSGESSPDGDRLRDLADSLEQRSFPHDAAVVRGAADALDRRAFSGLPDEPSEEAASAALQCFQAHAAQGYVMDAPGIWKEALRAAYRVDALPEREDGDERGEKYELRSLRRELATMLGPVTPRTGVSTNDLWIAKVGEVLIQRDEARAEVERLERKLGRYEKRDELTKQKRAAVPLSTDVLRKPSDDLERVVEQAIATDSDSQTHAAAVCEAIADCVEQQGRARPASDGHGPIWALVDGAGRVSRTTHWPKIRDEWIEQDEGYDVVEFRATSSQSPPSPAGDGETGLCSVRSPRMVVGGGEVVGLMCELPVGHAGDHRAGETRWGLIVPSSGMPSPAVGLTVEDKRALRWIADFAGDKLAKSSISGDDYRQAQARMDVLRRLAAVSEVKKSTTFTVKLAEAPTAVLGVLAASVAERSPASISQALEREYGTATVTRALGTLKEIGAARSRQQDDGIWVWAVTVDGLALWSTRRSVTDTEEGDRGC